jgi:hypothetical protein
MSAHKYSVVGLVNHFVVFVQERKARTGHQVRHPSAQARQVVSRSFLTSRPLGCDEYLQHRSLGPSMFRAEYLTSSHLAT